MLIIGLDRAGKTTLLERLKTLYTDVPGLEADKARALLGALLLRAHCRMQGQRCTLLSWMQAGSHSSGLSVSLATKQPMPSLHTPLHTGAAHGGAEPGPLSGPGRAAAVLGRRRRRGAARHLEQVRPRFVRFGGWIRGGSVYCHG